MSEQTISFRQELLDALAAARRDGRHALDEPTGKQVLRSAGMSVPRSVVIRAGEDIVSAISALTPPLVLKVVAPSVIHKSDVGGVRLNLADPAEAAQVADEVHAAMRAQGIEPEGWLVEEMAPRGVEVVVGGTMDPEFGPMVMVGLGGIFVEILKDVAFRICPITRSDGREMLSELKGFALLSGARGAEPTNLEAIVDVLLCIGGENGILVQGFGEIAEIDINPLIVSKDAAVAVDARFILQPKA